MATRSIFHLFADCLPVKGAVNATICDIGRNAYEIIPDDLYHILTVHQNKTLDEIKTFYQGEYDSVIDEYFAFLLENEFGMWMDEADAALLRPIEFVFDTPSHIDTAIVDFDANSHHDLDNICQQLAQLGCRFIQVRLFDRFSDTQINEWIKIVFHHRFLSSNWLMQYNPSFTFDDYSNFYLYRSDANYITVHSTPMSFFETDTFRQLNEKGVFRFVPTVIADHAHCGVIHPGYFTINILSFSEAKNYNSCLYKKIGIDVRGNIKNCPSMQHSFGNVKTTQLAAALTQKAFQAPMYIVKDKVNICRDCEFRYICTDCRAYTNDPNDSYAAPLKCGYNPYTCEWEDWSKSPIKQQAMAHYTLHAAI